MEASERRKSISEREFSTLGGEVATIHGEAAFLVLEQLLRKTKTFLVWVRCLGAVRAKKKPLSLNGAQPCRGFGEIKSNI